MVSRPVRPFTHRNTASKTVRAAVLGAAAVLVLASCAGEPESEKKAADPGDAYPVEVTSCGHTSTIEARPTKAITLNQGATEVVLALGLSDRLAGTAYLDDEIPEKWRAAYDAVPVLSDEYPTNEELVAADPDFLYASYGSAFTPEVAGTQTDLDEKGTASYLSPFGCEDKTQRPEPSFEAVWDEIDAVAKALGDPAAAEQFRDTQQAQLDELATTAAGEGLTVFWYDGGDKTPTVGAGGGGPQLVLDAVKATNIFADLDGGWNEGNWESVIAADPDVIVFADAAWSTAEEKIAYLRGDPVLSQLTAVQDEAFVTIPFSESTPGVRLVDGAVGVSEQLEKLAANR
ncbi:ABC transporter substrate-binding protein [Nocardioides sp. AE5]|uniref:ABC transporter substrate-binding protein n=1 Tax=Nocardioides sp. AE5 TaxID=2962573 RepID=UPI00288220C0|nr:ABC transporter substrate-binding protein [Nocardioides sp. AE5]MDT0202185.1 ABC transporter substrate-binding protein [Nocardioides sp. AE5]